VWFSVKVSGYYLERIDFLKKNELIEVKIESHEFPATGIGYLDGVKVFVKRAFPDQTVTARVSKNRNGKAEAKLRGVSEKAPYEIEAPCRHFGKCGGCISQNIPMDIQEKMKNDEVVRLFSEAGLSMGAYEGLSAVNEQYGYRNKMEFTFGDEVRNGELTLGMHYSGVKNAVVNVDGCLLVPEDFRRILSYTVEHFRKLGTPYYRVMKREGVLRHLMIRRGENTRELMVNLITTTKGELDSQAWRKGLMELELEYDLVSVLHTENDNPADAVNCDKLNVLVGRDHIFEELLGLRFKISPFSFFQTNTKGAELLYSTVRDFITGRKKEIFDLYCGTGTIGQIVSDYADKVTGVEIVEEAAAAANENAALNGLDHTTFIAGDVKDIIAGLKGSPDLIILDPPRSGVHPKALEYVVNFNAHEIIYVSCNPKTLVTDLMYLTAKGYVIKRTKVVDLFPNTPHVETVVLIERQKH